MKKSNKKLSINEIERKELEEDLKAIRKYEKSKNKKLIPIEKVIKSKK